MKSSVLTLMRMTTMTTTNMRWATRLAVVVALSGMLANGDPEPKPNEKQLTLFENQSALLQTVTTIATYINYKNPGTISEWKRALVSKGHYFKELQQDVARTAEDDISEILSILDRCGCHQDKKAACYSKDEECDIDELEDLLQLVNVVFNDMTVQKNLLTQSINIHKGLAKSPDKLKNQAAKAQEAADRAAKNGPTGDGAVGGAVGRGRKKNKNYYDPNHDHNPNRNGVVDSFVDSVMSYLGLYQKEHPSTAEDNDCYEGTCDSNNRRESGPDSRTHNRDGGHGSEPYNGNHREGNNGNHREGNNGNHREGNNGNYREGNNGNYREGDNGSYREGGYGSGTNDDYLPEGWEEVVDENGRPYYVHETEESTWVKPSGHRSGGHGSGVNGSGSRNHHVGGGRGGTYNNHEVNGPSGEAGRRNRNAGAGDYNRNAGAGDYNRNAGAGDYNRNAGAGHYNRNAGAGDYNRNAGGSGRRNNEYYHEYSREDHDEFKEVAYYVAKRSYPEVARSLQQFLEDNKPLWSLVHSSMEGDLVSLKSELNKLKPKMQSAMDTIEKLDSDKISEERILKKIHKRWKAIHGGHNGGYYNKIKKFQVQLLSHLEEFQRQID